MANVEVNSGLDDDAMFKDLIKTKDKVLFVWFLYSSLLVFVPF